MENLGKDMTTIYGTYHWSPLYPKQNCTQSNSQCQGIAKGLPDLSRDFHLYAVEWTSSYIQWYIDGAQYGSCTSSNVTLPPNQMYWILNTAIGGSWGGPPDSSTVWPQYHIIDYVRVYKSEIGRAVQQECRDRSRMPSSA
eukprot:TRINITY_DN4088_c0_g1_i1.p1 TRINITY_DN4088_c0_g1~~TRINITY_DN4088_c0_g1_i1.p1  ORF type:complete len:140 (+),score=8.01 TRINITY_DN4088_c0_g1_i1:81-500(+)